MPYTSYLTYDRAEAAPARRRKFRIVALFVLLGVVAAWNLPSLSGAWNYLVEQAVTNLVYTPNIEIRAREAGEEVAKKRRGLTERQLTLAFDRYAENLKDPVTKEPFSDIILDRARSAFIKGYQGE